MKPWAAVALLALAGCGDRFPTNGPCSSDADCRLCSVCSCERAYSSADVDGASCDTIATGAQCPPGEPPGCVTGALQALCVSGACQVEAR